MDAKFFDSLFEGDSTSGVKLCMGLTGGDFWARVAGCQNLYRGGSVEAVDFDIILAVTDADEDFIVLTAVQHAASTVYFYVLRRANCCGDEEQSLTASAKAAFDSQGDLIGEGCNRIFTVKAEQFAGPMVRFMWYYSPVEQVQRCVSFKVYGDNGSGQIDYENEVCVVDYVGARFYSYESGVLSTGRYLFCVKAVSSDGLESGISGVIEIQVCDSAPSGVKILHAQAV